MASGSHHAQTHAKAGMAAGRIPRRRNDRRGSILYAPALGKLEAWLALPRELALGRLAYAFKRPLVTLPQAPWRWHVLPQSTDHRFGKVGVRACRSQWARTQYKKKTN